MTYLNIKKIEGLSEWEYFVWRHKNTGNLIIHFISFVSSFVFIVLSIYLKNYWLLLGVLPSQYIGFLGHVFFKEGGARNKDFISPMTTIYLSKIFYLIAINKYKHEVSLVEKKIISINNKS